MSDLIGRFLSFEDSLGRGLVKFLYYILLALLVITTIGAMIKSFCWLFSAVDGDFWGHFRQLFWSPLMLVLSAMGIRVGAEVIMAILSIPSNGVRPSQNGDAFNYESGMTPAPQADAGDKTSTTVTDAPDCPQGAEHAAEAGAKSGDTPSAGDKPDLR